VTFVVSTPLAARRAAERWFLDRGLPSVVTTRARLRAVWPRSAPALAAYATVQVCVLIVFLLTGTTAIDIDGAPAGKEWIVLAIVVLAVPLALAVGWVIARMITDRAQNITSTVSVVAAGAASLFERDPTQIVYTAATVLLVVALTASGIGSVLGWAVRLTLSQLAAAGALVTRALPVVLLTVLVFFNTYVWVMAATVSGTRFSLALAFLMAIAVAFVISGLNQRVKPLLDSATASAHHAERLRGTPFEEMSDPPEIDPLTRGERFNVVFVLGASQIAQIAMVATITAGIFFVLGLILLSPHLLAEWTRNGSSDGSVFGMIVPVPQALIYMTLFLAALTFMYIGARAVGDGEYRTEFLDPLVDDLKLTLLARNRYRNSERMVHPEVAPASRRKIP
jgi:hypothetical protein